MVCPVAFTELSPPRALDGKLRVGVLFHPKSRQAKPLDSAVPTHHLLAPAVAHDHLQAKLINEATRTEVLRNSVPNIMSATEYSSSPMLPPLPIDRKGGHNLPTWMAESESESRHSGKRLPKS